MLVPMTITRSAFSRSKSEKRRKKTSGSFSPKKVMSGYGLLASIPGMHTAPDQRTFITPMSMRGIPSSSSLSPSQGLDLRALELVPRFRFIAC